ncbi:GNAT family N-acetyltransferase [Georgenia sp. 311]|uniref:GNAT family N-acetyltransferase n=1 Tax=Georgenia wutianyii TaxID=2585135 RepID=A0ABX5VMK9_9MICO|nr:MULTISPECIES: GNAT family N-acetyltransferase [Georgenia]QDB79443.1 GNAT family N-acetyltransferase [Georgenia wutianyii]TNC19505.1 GNAT family N-acetyltransferase [Georgenia sp. 311]
MLEHFGDAPRTPAEGVGDAGAPWPHPELPHGHDLRWRELTLADNDALVALLGRIEEHDNPPYRTTAEESAETFVQVGADVGTARTIAVDADGVPRAYAIVRVRPTAGTCRALCDGGVDPQWRRRGIGTTLLQWQLAAARSILDDAGYASALAVVHVEDDMTDFQDMLRLAGFVPTRFYTEMRRDLSLPLPEVEAKGKISVEPWDAALEDAVRRAHNDAFAGQWGAELHTPETWMQGRTYFAPSWSFVALDRTSDRARVAGYLISGRYEGDWAAQGWTEGYTELLGVREEWRGMRVATALLVTAMRAYAADGMQYAGLGVDSPEPGGDFGLFGNLGYEPTRHSLMFTRAV